MKNRTNVPRFVRELGYVRRHRRRYGTSIPCSHTRSVTVAIAVLLTSIAPQLIAAVGDLYQADFGSGNVYRYTPAGVKSTFASGLGSPAGLAFDPKGNLFVGNNAGTIIKVTPNGTKTTFASGLNKPFGVAVDANGNIFEADEGSGNIFEFTPAGVRTTFATGLSSPAGLAFDPAGNLFVSNFTGGSITKITPNGTKSTFATGLSFPDGLAFSPFGGLLECDSGSGNVFSFTATGVKSTVATGFFQNSGVIEDASGNIFVTQNAAGNITRIASNGTKTIFASGLFNPQYMAFEPGTAALTNISTRAFVGTGNDVLVAGFILSGTQAKAVLVRGLGPALSHFGIANPLPDPTLVLLNANGTVIASNNDWQNGGNSAQIPQNLRPPDSLESAILITLAPGKYTAVEAGNNSSTGLGLVEVYDLNPASLSELANISTRGLVETGTNVMISGFINSGGNGSTKVLVRALGPTLAQLGIANPLPNPTLQLTNANGQVVASNDDWKTTQPFAIQATGLAPPNDLESAILITLSNGSYTAIVVDKNGATGVGEVEVYNIK